MAVNERAARLLRNIAATEGLNGDALIQRHGPALSNELQSSNDHVLQRLAAMESKFEMMAAERLALADSMQQLKLLGPILQQLQALSGNHLTMGSTLPLGLTSHDSRHSEEKFPSLAPLPRRIGDLRVWTGTFNMNAKDPFTNIDINRNIDKLSQHLADFVPKQCDLYVLAVQEGTSDAFLDAVSLYTGCYRLPLNAKLLPAKLMSKVRSRRMGHAMRVEEIIQAEIVGNELPPVDSPGDMLDRVIGRGDGAFLTPKFTGIAVYVAPIVAPYVRLLGIYKHSFGASEGSKGGVGVAISAYDTTMAFVSCHLASKKVVARRQQYTELVRRLGEKLGGRGFELNEQFHHIIWMGDLNYHIRDISASTALDLIEDGSSVALMQEHDELLQEKDDLQVFHNYFEPPMSPDFLPSYKRVEPRGPLDTSVRGWAAKLYHTSYKEPFYKGGRVVERLPSWTDRIQYHSLEGRMGELEAERLDPMDPESPANYRTVDSALGISDHAPVLCTWNLQIQMDADEEQDSDVEAALEEESMRQGGGMSPGSRRGGTLSDGGVSDDLPVRILAPAAPASAGPSKGIEPRAAIHDPESYLSRWPTDMHEWHPSKLPLTVVFRVAEVKVDFKGQMRTPRAINVMFPLPYEDSDFIPERAKIVRADKFAFITTKSETREQLSATVKQEVSRADKLDRLHLLVKVSFDDNTKAQFIVGMQESGFTYKSLVQDPLARQLTEGNVSDPSRWAMVAPVTFSTTKDFIKDVTCGGLPMMDRRGEQLVSCSFKLTVTSHLAAPDILKDIVFSANTADDMMSASQERRRSSDARRAESVARILSPSSATPRPYASSPSPAMASGGGGGGADNQSKYAFVLTANDADAPVSPNAGRYPPPASSVDPPTTTSTLHPPTAVSPGGLSSSPQSHGSAQDAYQQPPRTSPLNRATPSHPSPLRQSVTIPQPASLSASAAASPPQSAVIRPTTTSPTSDISDVLARAQRAREHMQRQQAAYAYSPVESSAITDSIVISDSD